MGQKSCTKECGCMLTFSAWERVFVRVVILRAIMITHIALSTWRVADVMQNNAFWFLALMCVIVLIKDGLELRKNCEKQCQNKGCKKQCEPPVEYNDTTSKWRSTLIVYVVCMVPIVWILTYHLHSSASTLTPSGNASTLVTTTQESIILGLEKLEDRTWIWVVINSMMYILLFTRCLYDGSSDDSKLSENLLGFLGTASDIMDLFSLFEEEEILQSQLLTYLILFAWTLSLFQFAPILSNFDCFKRRKPYGEQNTTDASEVSNAKILLVIAVQDGPFIIVRVLIMVVLMKAMSNLVFFIIKNIVTLILADYKTMDQYFKKKPPKRNYLL
ncbi:transmembrane protein 26-like [Mya arenaria]|uniref:transmembrane protein 26-like n=1 Tax=Mya arenaria TaxID=6604 RepID=UPI0022E1E6C9|nr:transmembrane protein 26-like [Mya arenaria]